MKKIIFMILIVLVFNSCTVEPKAPYVAKEMPVKWCVDECIHDKFRMFKNNQLLGSSSTMNGLSQGDIFDTVFEYCKGYYTNKCYKNVLNNIHGFATDTDSME